MKIRLGDRAPSLARPEILFFVKFWILVDNFKNDIESYLNVSDDFSMIFDAQKMISTDFRTFDKLSFFTEHRFLFPEFLLFFFGFDCMKFFTTLLTPVVTRLTADWRP